ncbi:MAG: helix-turn-helix transcriptional regulator [Nitrospirae bacterium]|nr:helix-turn-helix transcriptional regulator [Nitrospirota bacterium]
MLGEKIRKAREYKEITQEELAEKCGVSSVYINYLENNKRRASYKLLMKIADVLEIPISELSKDLSLKTDSEQRLLEVLRDHDITKPEELEFVLKDLRRLKDTEGESFLAAVKLLAAEIGKKKGERKP